MPFDLYNELGSLVLPYERFVGCENDCHFCVTNQSLVVKEMDSIVRDLAVLKSKYNTGYFSFFDAGTNVLNQYARMFAEVMIRSKLDIEWWSYAKPGGLSKDIFKLLRKSGCVHLRYGLESGSNKVLRLMGKTHTVQSAREVIRDAKEFGIYNHILLILDFPCELDEDFWDTLEFIEYNSDYIDSVQIMKLILFRESYIHNNFKDFNIQISKSYDLVPTSWLKYENLNIGMNFQEKYEEVMKLCARNRVEVLNVNKSNELLKRAFKCTL